MYDLAKFLKKRLQKTLPGEQAQLKMAPRPVSEGKMRETTAPEGTETNRSSVLILLFPNENEDLELALTLRSKDIDHGGQISFPGGRAEKGETNRETALREAHEEIGVNAREVTVVGELSELYVRHSNNRVTPVVGFMNKRPDFSINPAEVAELFTVELAALLTKKNLTEENWELRQHSYRVPFWDVHTVPLWGATAMMLSELLDLYREFLKQQERYPS